MPSNDDDEFPRGDELAWALLLREFRELRKSVRRLHRKIEPLLREREREQGEVDAVTRRRATWSYRFGFASGLCCLVETILLITGHR